MICECHTKMRRKGYFKNRQKWECPNCGKIKTEGAKKHLSEEDIERIRVGAANGTTQVALARMFNVSRQAIIYHLKKN